MNALLICKEDAIISCLAVEHSIIKNVFRDGLRRVKYAHYVKVKSIFLKMSLKER